MLAKGRFFHNFIVEIAISDFHHEKGLLAADVESIGWKDVWVLTVEMYFAFVDEEVKLYFVFAEGLHCQDHAIYVGFGEDYLACLALAEPLDHFELVLRLLGLDVPDHLQGLAHLGAHLCLLFLFPKVFLGLVSFCYYSGSESLLQVLKGSIHLPGAQLDGAGLFELSSMCEKSFSGGFLGRSP